MAQLERGGAEFSGGGAAAVAAPRWSLNWVVGPRLDLLCFIGAAALGYGMFFLHAGLAMDMVAVWFVWYMFLDSPHFFATYSRTYLDREEMRSRRRLLRGSLGLLAVGPLVFAGCLALFAAKVEWYKTPYFVLATFVSIWAYWHVVRQHFGIMSLYKRKNGDGAAVDARLDRWVLYLGLMTPFVAFIVRNEEARGVVGRVLGVSPGAYAATPWALDTLIVDATVVVTAAALVTFGGRQLQRLLRGETLNLAKILFLGAVIPLHLVVCYHPKSTTLALLGFSACVTIFHDVQYHAIVWWYQRNRMGKAGAEAPAKYGLAARIGTSFPIYACCAVGMGLAMGLLGCLLDVNPGCIPVIGSRDILLFGSELSMNELFYGIFLGVLMHHYFVDQFLWRPSKDQNLKADLRLEQQPVRPR